MKSLKRILFTRYAVAVTVIVITVMFMLIYPIRSQVKSAKEAHLVLESRTIAALFKSDFLEGRTPEMQRMARDIYASTAERLTVLDADGSVLVSSHPDAELERKSLEGPGKARVLGGREAVWTTASPFTGENYIFAAVPIKVEDNVLGATVVSAREGALSPGISPNWFVAAGGLVFLLLLILGVTFWTQRTLASDLREIDAGFENMVLDNDLDRMPQPRVAELFDLAEDMDTIASRVRENYRLLSTERDKLKAVLESINAGMIVLGVDGRIELINPVAETLLGVGREYALGRTLNEVHTAGAIDAAVQRSRRGAQVTDEVRISTPADAVLSITASPILSDDGRISGVICVLDDVTATRRLERMRREFVANVSHELRTPVASFRAICDALVEGAIDDPDASRRFLASLDSESMRLMRIIEDLLALSRLESDGFQVERRPFDLAGLVDEVLAEKSATAQAQEVGLLLAGDRAPVIVSGDRKLVKTAVSNLIDNAIKYNEPGGRVDVRLEKAGLDATLEVEDTGIGIPSRDQEKVFERFYRVDRARSRETGGTGLGLSIVKHVAELHGGTVAVRSTEGFGSTFSFTVPLA